MQDARKISAVAKAENNFNIMIGVYGGAKITRPNEYQRIRPALVNLVLCFFESFVNGVPVYYVPPGGDIVGTAVLIVEVVCMFPYIQA